MNFSLKNRKSFALVNDEQLVATRDEKLDGKTVMVEIRTKAGICVNKLRFPVKNIKFFFL